MVKQLREDRHGSVLLFQDVPEARDNWGWFFALGLALLVLGVIAIGFSVATTMLTIILLGILLLGVGVVQVVHAFWASKWSGFFLSTLIGLLYIVTGALCVFRPAASALSLTLLIAAFFFVGGLFKMIYSLFTQFDHWGWVFFNGLISFILGILIFNDWPLSGLWVIGLFVGIDMVLAGWVWMLLALRAKPVAVTKR